MRRRAFAIAFFAIAAWTVGGGCSSSTPSGVSHDADGDDASALDATDGSDASVTDGGPGSDGTATDGGPRDADSGPCPPGESLYYVTAGCNAAPVCVSDIQDACAGIFCGCDGVTFYGGCGTSRKPFAHTGACDGADAGDATAHH